MILYIKHDATHTVGGTTMHHRRAYGAHRQVSAWQKMDYPGTGPFRHKKRIDKEVWIVERNPDYWNEGLPYLDGIEFYHLAPFSPEMGGSLLAGKLDYARLLDPVSL